MNGITEKKWFVFIGDRHIGPHSIEEVVQKVTAGQLTLDHFVWAEGMTDWKLMREVSDFDTVLVKKPTPAPVESSVRASQVDSSLIAEVQSQLQPMIHNEPTLLTPVAQTSVHRIEPNLSAVNRPEGPNFTEIASDEIQKEVSLPQKSWLGKIVKALGICLFVFFLLTAGLSVAYVKGFLEPILRLPTVQHRTDKVMESLQPTLLSLTESFPSLGKWISPIAKLEDISSEEYEGLKAAAKENLKTKGPHFGMGLSNQDPLAPSLYIATNLPDGAQLNVVVVGISDTLLNQLSFQAQYPVTINKKLGKTPALRDLEGKPVPRGEYVIYLTLSETSLQSHLGAEVGAQEWVSSLPSLNLDLPKEFPKGLRVLATKPYFLGGTKDESYSTRLKEYHDRLRVRAMAEISEVKQFMVTLDNQLSSTNLKFNLLHKGKVTPAQKKAWESFHREWVKFQEQLEQIFQRWTPEVIQNEYFYSPLYLLVQQAGREVQKVHGFQFAYFKGAPIKELKVLESQLSEAVAGSTRAMATLKSKLEQLESLPPTPNGMPPRITL